MPDKFGVPGSTQVRSPAPPAAARTGSVFPAAPKAAPAAAPAVKAESAAVKEEGGAHENGGSGYTPQAWSTFIFSGLVSEVDGVKGGIRLSNAVGFVGRTALGGDRDRWVHPNRKTRITGAVAQGQKALVIGRSVQYETPDGTEKWFRYPDILVMGDIDIHEALSGLTAAAREAQQAKNSQQGA